MRTRRTHSAATESLEARRLLAATITDGILVGTGTSGADVISVRLTLTDDVVVTINGIDSQFDTDDLTGVRLEGLGGNDTFQMFDEMVSPGVRTTLVGGDGTDTVDLASFVPAGGGIDMRSFPGVENLTNVRNPSLVLIIACRSRKSPRHCRDSRRANNRKRPKPCIAQAEDGTPFSAPHS